MKAELIANGERVYLPELDGLRFVAFLLVFGFHGGLPWIADLISALTLPLFALTLPLGEAASGRVADLGPAVGRALRQNGWVGVQLFFILSGYLITRLLLREEGQFGRVDLRAFWARRILRIWPLYYLTVALTFLVLPALHGRLDDPGFWRMIRVHLPWFLAFLGNWSLIRNGPIGDDAISILWSVCVEEQFYLVCPLLIAWIGRGWRLPLVATGMIAAVTARAVLASARAEQYMIQYNAFAQLDTLLAGVGLALVLDLHRGRGLNRRISLILGYATGLGAVWLLTRPELAHVRPDRQVVDFVAIWVVGLGVVAFPVLVDGRTRRWLAKGWLVDLGRISYGLYMFHEIGLWSARRTLGAWIAPEIPALVLTIALARVSFDRFERPFLRLKAVWTRVPSRPV